MCPNVSYRDILPPNHKLWVILVFDAYGFATGFRDATNIFLVDYRHNASAEFRLYFQRLVYNNLVVVQITFQAQLLLRKQDL